MSLAARLKQRLGEQGMSQRELADRINMSHVAISKLASGKTETSRKIMDIAEVLGCSVEWLLNGTPESARSRDNVLIPLLSATLSAGPGAYSETDDVIDWIPICKEWLLDNNLQKDSIKAVTVVGDSMLSRLHDGDTILIDTSSTQPVSGKIYAISVDNELKVKRLIKRIGGAWVISSDNKADPAYQDETISAHNFEQLRIIGRAIKIVTGDL